jgi:hypothetical protein
MDTPTLRESLTDSIRYWEPRRIVYNVVLAVITICYFVVNLPASKHALSINSLLFIFLLAVLANVAYCAAYLADVFTQLSGFREIWRTYRWVLFVIGLAFASVITRFWALGMFAPGTE